MTQEQEETPHEQLERVLKRVRDASGSSWTNKMQAALALYVLDKNPENIPEIRRIINGE